MKTQLTLLAVAATALTVLTGCNPDTTPVASSSTTPVGAGASGGLGSPSDVESGAPSPATGKSAPKTTAPHPGSTPTTHKTTSPPPSGPRISFKVAQKPKCAEGTAVFRADPVPLIIKWKITHATSGALSVDDPTHTAGTYGPVDLEGTEEFRFGCNGPVGSTETHTYAIYSVGGGSQRSKSLTVSAKVLDKGKTGS
jgi:hypothetical protein